MATNTTQNEIRTEEDLSLEELLVKTTLLRPLNKQTAEYDLPPPQEPEIYKDGESKFSIPFLHFASCSTKNVIISHNGLCAECISEDDNWTYIVADRGWRSGTHYWEYFCPTSCTNLEFGVVQKKETEESKDNCNSKNTNNVFSIEHFQILRTSTSRRLGFALDLDKKVLRICVEGYEWSKSLNVRGGEAEKNWYPALKMKYKQNKVCLNPFPTFGNNVNHLPYKIPIVDLSLIDAHQLHKFLVLLDLPYIDHPEGSTNNTNITGAPNREEIINLLGISIEIWENAIAFTSYNENSKTYNLLLFFNNNEERYLTEEVLNIKLKEETPSWTLATREELMHSLGLGKHPIKIKDLPTGNVKKAKGKGKTKAKKTKKGKKGKKATKDKPKKAPKATVQSETELGLGELFWDVEEEVEEVVGKVVPPASPEVAEVPITEESKISTTPESSQKKMSSAEEELKEMVGEEKGVMEGKKEIVKTPTKENTSKMEEVSVEGDISLPPAIETQTEKAEEAEEESKSKGEVSNKEGEKSEILKRIEKIEVLVNKFRVGVTESICNMELKAGGPTIGEERTPNKIRTYCLPKKWGVLVINESNRRMQIVTADNRERYSTGKITSREIITSITSRVEIGLPHKSWMFLYKFMRSYLSHRHKSPIPLHLLPNFLHLIDRISEIGRYSPSESGVMLGVIFGDIYSVIRVLMEKMWGMLRGLEVAGTQRMEGGVGVDLHGSEHSLYIVLNILGTMEEQIISRIPPESPLLSLLPLSRPYSAYHRLLTLNIYPIEEQMQIAEKCGYGVGDNYTKLLFESVKSKRHIPLLQWEESMEERGQGGLPYLNTSLCLHTNNAIPFTIPDGVSVAMVRVLEGYPLICIGYSNTHIQLLATFPHLILLGGLYPDNQNEKENENSQLFDLQVDVHQGAILVYAILHSLTTHTLNLRVIHFGLSKEEQGKYTQQQSNPEQIICTLDSTIFPVKASPKYITSHLLHLTFKAPYYFQSKYTPQHTEEFSLQLDAKCSTFGIYKHTLLIEESGRLYMLEKGEKRVIDNTPKDINLSDSRIIGIFRNKLLIGGGDGIFEYELECNAVRRLRGGIDGNREYKINYEGEELLIIDMDKDRIEERICLMGREERKEEREGESDKEMEMDKDKDKDMEMEIPGSTLTKRDLEGYGCTEGLESVGCVPKDHPSTLLLSKGCGGRQHTWNLLRPLRRGENMELELRVTGAPRPPLQYLSLQIRFYSPHPDSHTINSLKGNSSNLEQGGGYDTGGDTYIPMQLAYAEGAPNGHNKHYAHILTPNSEEFLSNYPRPIFVFEHLHLHKIVPEKYTVSSSLSKTEKNSPVGKGLVYGMDNLSSLDLAIHRFTKQEQFNQWREKRLEGTQPLQEWEPIAYFDLGTSEENEFSLATKGKAYRYIVLKPTAFRSEFKMFSANPLSIKFFGVKGTLQGAVGKATMSPSIVDRDIKNIDLKAGYKLQIFGENSKELHQEDVPLTHLTLQPGHKSVSMMASSNLLISNKEIISTVSPTLKIRLTASKSRIEYKLLSVSIACKESKSSEGELDSLRSFSSKYLRRCLIDPQVFSRINKGVCELVYDAERCSEERERAFVLMQTMCAGPMLQMVWATVDQKLPQLLEVNLLGAAPAKGLHSFLSRLKGIEGFLHQLEALVRGYLTDISKRVYSPESIAHIFKLIPLLPQNTQTQIAIQLVEQQKSVCQLITDLNTRETVYIRTVLKMNTFSLSREIYQAPPQVNKKEQSNIESKYKCPMPCVMASIINKSTGIFYIDLGVKGKVEEICIYFKAQEAIPWSILNISVMAYDSENVDESPPRVVASKEMDESIWDLVSNQGHNSNITDKFCENMDCVTLPLSTSVETRYIQVKADLSLTYNYIYALPEDKPKSNALLGLLPQVYGTKIEDPSTPSPPYFEEVFGGLEDSMLDTDKVKITKTGHSQIYQFVHAGGHSGYNYYKFMPQELAQTGTQPQKKSITPKIFPKEEYGRLQKSLSEEINKLNGKEDPSSITHIKELITKIGEIQLEHFDQIKVSGANGEKCLEYLMFISDKMCSFIGSLKNIKESTEKELLTSDDCLKIFEQLVAYNIGKSQEQHIEYIKDTVMKVAGKEEWNKFILNMMDHFFWSSIKPLSSLSHIINTIGLLDIDLEQLFPYIQTKLMKLEQTTDPNKQGSLVFVLAILAVFSKSIQGIKLQREKSMKDITTLKLAVKNLKDQQKVELEKQKQKEKEEKEKEEEKSKKEDKIEEAGGTSIEDEKKEKTIVDIDNSKAKEESTESEGKVKKEENLNEKLEKSKDKLKMSKNKLDKLNKQMCELLDFLNFISNWISDSTGIQKKEMIMCLKLSINQLLVILKMIDLQTLFRSNNNLDKLINLLAQSFILKESELTCSIEEILSILRDNQRIFTPEACLEFSTFNSPVKIGNTTNLFPPVGSQYQLNIQKNDNLGVEEEEKEGRNYELDHRVVKVRLQLCKRFIKFTNDMINKMKNMEDDIQKHDFDNLCLVIDNYMAFYKSIEDHIKDISKQELLMDKKEKAEKKKKEQEEAKGEKAEKDVVKLENSEVSVIKIDAMGASVDYPIIPQKIPGKKLKKKILKKKLTNKKAVTTTTTEVKTEEDHKEMESFEESKELINLREELKEGRCEGELAQNLFWLIKEVKMSEGSLNRLWESSLKVVSELEVKELVKCSMFEDLMESYLMSGSEIQLTMYPSILSITCKIVKESKGEELTQISEYILGLVMATMERTMSTDMELIGYELCRGWLQILLTLSDTPPLNNPPESAKSAQESIHVKCPLQTKTASMLLNKFATLVWNTINFGDFKGPFSAMPTMVIRASLLSNLAQLLTLAELPADIIISTSEEEKLEVALSEENTGEKQSTMEEIPKEEEITQEKPKAPQKINYAIEKVIMEDGLEECFEYLMSWLLLNYADYSDRNTFIKEINEICKAIKSLFTYVRQNISLCDHLLGYLCKNIVLFDDFLREKAQNMEIHLGTAQSISNRINELFEFFITNLMVNEQLANKFAIDLKGLDLLFQRLGIGLRKSEGESMIENEEIFSIIKEIESKGRIISKTEDMSSSKANNEGEEEKEGNVMKNISKTDLAGQMKLISAGTAISANFQGTVWNQNKQGNKTKIIDQELLENECSFTYDLKEASEISEVQIGMVIHWQYEPFDYVEPASVILEGGMTKDSLQYICRLNKVHDRWMMSNSINVFASNFNAFHLQSNLADTLLTTRILNPSNKQNIINQKLQSLRNVTIRYIRFTCRPSVPMGLSHSMGAPTNNKKKMGISYISILGNKAISKSSIYEYLVNNSQKYSFKILNMFQMKQFRPSLKHFANNFQIIHQIKQSFTSLLSLLVPGEITIQPILIAFSSNNEELSKWILSQLFKVKITKSVANFILDICLSNCELIANREIILREFIFAILTKDEGEVRREDIMNLLPLITEYTKLLMIGGSLLKTSSDLKVAPGVITRMLKLFSNYIEEHQAPPSHIDLLLRFLIFLIKPPQLFINSAINPSKLLLELIQQGTNKISLFVGCILGVCDKESAQVLADNYSVPLGLTDLSLIGAAPENVFKEKVEILLTICLCPQVAQKIGSEMGPMLLYQGIKDPENKTTRVRQPSSDILDKYISLIGTTFTEKVESEKFVELIIKDMQEIPEIEEKESFIGILINILKVERSLPICLHPYDRTREQYLSIDYTDDSTLLRYLNPCFLESPAFTTTMKEAFEKKIRERIGVESQVRKLFSKNWKLMSRETGALPQNSKSDFTNFWSKIGGKSPVVVLLKGIAEGKRVVLGCFSLGKIPEKPDTVSNSQTYDIKSMKEDFYFYYEEGGRLLHFENKTGQNFLGHVYVDYQGCGAFVFGNYFFCLSYSYSYSTSIGNISQFTCLDEHVGYLPYSFTMEEIEVYSVEGGSSFLGGMGADDLILPIAQILPKNHIWFNSHSPALLLRNNPVFQVPAHITLDTLAKCLVGKKTNFRVKGGRRLDLQESVADIFGDTGTYLGVLDIEYDEEEEEVEKGSGKDSVKDKGEIAERAAYQQGGNYRPNAVLLDKFEQAKEGITVLLTTAKSTTESWKNQKFAGKCKQYIEEIQMFNSLPLFFKNLLTHKKSKRFLFDILGSVPDKESRNMKAKEKELYEKRWEIEYFEAVTYCYKVIGEIFEESSSAELREKAAEIDLMSIILLRIENITGEKRRHFEQLALVRDPSLIKEKSREVEIEVQKKKKRKGVGYTTGVGEEWDVDQYLKDKKAKNSQLASMLNIIANFIKCEEWEPDEVFLMSIYESCLLPLLENALRSGSLLDMAKESDLFFSYLLFITNVATNPKLREILIEIDPHYIPPQREPIWQLLGNLNDLSKIFLNCLTKEDDIKEENKTPKELAMRIKNCHEFVSGSLQDLQNKSKEEHIKNALSLPLGQRYKVLLKDLRFDYMDMKDPGTGKYKHYYASTAEQETSPSQEKLIRLAQELADLSKALPEEHTSAIFVRVDEERVDLMKALIMGANGTPYGHGAFEYDIYFPSTYPNEPPKMQLITTGAGSVRFNPNLYADGKLCLSLLGTWRGASATENWDAKYSTILQVLMSTQAIIMSEEVYFNEPGFEGEAGTVEGEKKNVAYSNIVKYCNLKFAMLEHLQTPLKGFVSVISRHFYIKKEDILKEVEKWIELAGKQAASYSGLVQDHNYNWCNKFKGKNKYKEMLNNLCSEFKIAIEKLEAPSVGGTEKKDERKLSRKLTIDISEGVVNLDEVDVGYGESESTGERKLDISDEGVKDRWSRYIGAMGIEAVAKQADAHIFLSGAGALGIEIAKNIVLSGCKSFTLHDYKNITRYDISGQFFAGTEDIGKNRAEVSVDKLRHLNYYVGVEALTSPLPNTKDQLDLLGLAKMSVIILTECDMGTQLLFSKYCREKGIYFIVADARGCICRIFNDFGDEFIVLDKDGEEGQEWMVADISNEDPGVVKMQAGVRHNLEEGDRICIKEVKGMLSLGGEEEGKTKGAPKVVSMMSMDSEDPQGESINTSIHQVSILDPFSFTIGDTTKYTQYISGGIIKSIKTPRVLNFTPLEQAIHSLPFDQNMSIMDFTQMDYLSLSHILFLSLDNFREAEGRVPKPWDWTDMTLFLSQLKKMGEEKGIRIQEEEENWAKKVIFTLAGEIPALGALVGGIVAQEAIKAITQKFTPICQYMYYNVLNLLPEITTDILSNPAKLSKFVENEGLKPSGSNKSRTDGVEVCLGGKLMENLGHTKLFMVGAGAIGCELLKNYAMIGLGTLEKTEKAKEGKLIITDPDVIEVSNLNRQFLFREKHLRKSKTGTAAAAAIQMNPKLKSHILARLEKVQEESAHIFSDEFFESVDIVTNALDNVQARRYMDKRCVSAKVPLVESGTLGPKGHVQVILPYKTESYTSQQDPDDTFSIPHCTLKMFPEETLHCVEWALDKFGKLFTQKPLNLIRVVEHYLAGGSLISTSQEIKNMKDAIKLLKKRPSTFGDCISYGRGKFEKYFLNDIVQLMYVYPIDTRTKEGTEFWSLPKRPPVELIYDPSNIIHSSLISSCACLWATTWNIAIPSDPRSEKSKYGMGDEASRVAISKFVVSKEKAKNIEEEVTKEEEGPGEEEPIEEPISIENIDSLVNEFITLVSQLGLKRENEDVGKQENVETQETTGNGIKDIIQSKTLEKDMDSNFHIDFIHAMGNCRASNYKLESMDWITTKLKAGRIIPALASTTATIAALQTLEVIKVIKGLELSHHRNTFLNLALPSCTLSEPAPPKLLELTPHLTINLWDRWDIKMSPHAALADLFAFINDRYLLIPRDLFYGNKPIILGAALLSPDKKTERDRILKMKLIDLLNVKDEKYVDLTITCAKEEKGKILSGIPVVRIIFQQKL